MALKTDTTYNGLPVCGRCGWPMAGLDEIEKHAGECPHAVAGASAVRLAERLDDLPSTKFGYGTRQLAFEIDRELSVRLKCNPGRTFYLEDVWLLDDLTQDEAADLVRSIAAWRRGCLNMRRRG